MNVQPIHEKTFKREIAYVVFALWLSVTVWLFLFLPPAMVHHYEEMYGDLTLYSFLYIGAAMGMKVFQNYAAAKVGG